MDFTFTQFCGKINAADNLLIFKNTQIANVTDKEVKDVPTMHIVPLKSGQLALILMRPSMSRLIIEQRSYIPETLL